MLFLFSKKKRLLIPDDNEELVSKVKQVEEFLNEKMTIWDDEERFDKLQKLNGLSLEERRLYIVYALFDCNINRLANLFICDRKTVESRINEIKEKIK